MPYTYTLIAHATPMVQKDSSRIGEHDLGSNKFASLVSLKEEDLADADK